MSTFTITHETTDRAINEQVKADLAAAVADNTGIYGDFSDLKRLDKVSLVSYAKECRDACKAEHDAEQVKVEEERQAQIAAEVSDQVMNDTLVGMRDCVAKQVASATKTITDFTSRVAADPMSVGSELSWRMEGVLYSRESLDHIMPLHAFINRQLVERKWTAEEFCGHLVDGAKRSVKRCMEHGVDLQCRPVHYAKSVAENKAERFHAQAMAALVECWQECVVDRSSTPETVAGWALGFIHV